MKKIILLAALSLMMCVVTKAANPFGLVVLIEDCGFTDQKYYYSDNWYDIRKFTESELTAGRRVVSVAHVNFGWIAVTGLHTRYARQDCRYLRTKEFYKYSVKCAKDGLYVSSIGYGDVDQMGAYNWFTTFSNIDGVTDQISKFLKIDDIPKFAEKQYNAGYRITAVSGSDIRFMTVMQRGTNIDRQVIGTYEDYVAMMSDIQMKWYEGYSVQLAGCNAYGKFVAVYCTYKDGRQPHQNIKVCFDLDDAKEFIAENTDDRHLITHLGGSYYIQPQADWAEIVTGILTSASNIATMATGSNGGGSVGGSSATSSGGSSSGGSYVSGKCSSCQGSGTCCAVRQSCHGSGKCSYCNGDGFNYAAGSPVKCNGCNGTGKCKYCGGSGKCPNCKGSGKA